MRVLFTVMGILAFLVPNFMSGQSTAPRSAEDITVRLFYSQHVQRVTVTSNASSLGMRACPHCPEVAFHSPMDIRRNGPKIVIGDRQFTEIQFSGQLCMRTDSGRMAAGAGLWHVRTAPDGLHVTVTIPSERYVMAVLSAEASSTDPESALEALAIVVRTYTFTVAGRHGADDARVCDSTHCQALRLGSVSPAIQRAVNATAGETLWFRGKRADAFFTQNCGGITEDASAVWGGTQKPWLKSHLDSYCQNVPSHWHASLSEDELLRSLVAAGFSMRTISNLRVSQRDPSGRAKTLAISSGSNAVEVPAPKLRFAVGRTLGWDQLRSDWYTTSFQNGHAIFDGKGFGHGVGLCQAGAAAMAQLHGADARAILGFYFPGAMVRISPNDDGWHRALGHGWTLDDTDSQQDTVLLRDGDAALAHAQALSGLSNAHALSVRAFPSTELFRGTTGEPGWVAASTVGDRIALQPIVVIERHEPLRDALLHEMLHGLIEQASAPDTPLWLREGLVEALTDPHGSTTAMMTLPQIDAALSHPQTADQAKLTHEAAAADVRKLIAANGLSTVRGWLRTGVPQAAVGSIGAH